MRPPLPTTLALLLILAVAAATPSGADDSAGWRIYRDPDTGQLGEPPAQTVPRAEERSTAAVPALEEQVTPSGTAAFVDLRGQFRAAVRAERGADGVHVECGQAQAACSISTAR